MGIVLHSSASAAVLVLPQPKFLPSTTASPRKIFHIILIKELIPTMIYSRCCPFVSSSSEPTLMDAGLIITDDKEGFLRIRMRNKEVLLGSTIILAMDEILLPPLHFIVCCSGKEHPHECCIFFSLAFSYSRLILIVINSYYPSLI